MKLVCTAQQVREMDRRVIEDLGLPGIALMDLASRAVAQALVDCFQDAARRGVVVVCGGGNNGGDGYGCARWLAGWGFPVSIMSLTEKSSGDAGVMRAVCEKMGLATCQDMAGAGLVVDAVFGTGLAREVTGRYAKVLEDMAANPAPVVAVDLPSGLNSDTGAVMGVAVPAAMTVTFGCRKCGMYGEPGAGYCGEIVVADIGLAASKGEARAEMPERRDLAEYWPCRDPGDHKTRSGHLLVIAGSTAMAGAAVLCCKGALAAGAGLLSLCVPRGAHARLHGLPPEVMILPGGEGDLFEPKAVSQLEKYGAIVAGPGLGGGAALSEETAYFLLELWAAARVPVIYDADALPFAQGPTDYPRVITPHPGEAARILGQGIMEVQSDRYEAAEALASEKRVALLKGRNTLIAETGHRVSINSTGCEVLATGGAGDVLSGVIGGLLCRGLAARDAARLGAWVHGKAADMLRERRAIGWTAQDVVHEIPEAVARLLDRRQVDRRGKNRLQ